MVKVGQIGKGKFGGKILTKLNSTENISIEWVCGSQDKWWSQSNVDWVIVASPNEFHYEQVKYFLKNSINVFCEKPLTNNIKNDKILFKIAKKNKCKLYVSDVENYKDKKINIKKNCFLYCKKYQKFETLDNSVEILLAGKKHKKIKNYILNKKRAYYIGSHTLS